MKEPNETITKVHFHVGQQFGTKVYTSVDRYKTLDSNKNPPTCMDWHQHGIKITINGVTRVCSLATVHGIDVQEPNPDRQRFDTAAVANEIAEKRGPGRPRINA